MKCIWGTGWSQITGSTEPWVSMEEGEMRQVKGGWRFHGVKHLSAKANEPGFHSEDQDK